MIKLLFKAKQQAKTCTCAPATSPDLRLGESCCGGEVGGVPERLPRSSQVAGEQQGIKIFKKHNGKCFAAKKTIQVLEKAFWSLSLKLLKY